MINQRLRLLDSARFPHLVKFPRHSLFSADNVKEVFSSIFSSAPLFSAPRGSLGSSNLEGLLRFVSTLFIFAQ